MRTDGQTCVSAPICAKAQQWTGIQDHTKCEKVYNFLLKIIAVLMVETYWPVKYEAVIIHT
jgi:hypothetical protein